MNILNCPCGNKKTYADCCKKVHSNILNATTAEKLMRSRYTAFTQSNIDYLIKSWSPKTCDNSIKAKREIKKWASSVNWIKLEIINSTKGQPKDLTGTVEFKAYYFENGQVNCIHENSLFTKENNHWVYLNEL